MDANQTNPHNVLPLIKSNLSIPEIAERLGISVEAACALVVASLRSSRAPALTLDEATASPLRENDDSVLLSAGFVPAEGGDLWRRNGTWYGREAALQLAFGA
jgi:hypothetical protein